jgi:hypothetical protein
VFNLFKNKVPLQVTYPEEIHINVTYENVSALPRAVIDLAFAVHDSSQAIMRYAATTDGQGYIERDGRNLFGHSPIGFYIHGATQDGPGVVGDADMIIVNGDDGFFLGAGVWRSGNRCPRRVMSVGYFAVHNAPGFLSFGAETTIQVHENLGIPPSIATLNTRAKIDVVDSVSLQNKELILREPAFFALTTIGKNINHSLNEGHDYQEVDEAALQRIGCVTQALGRATNSVLSLRPLHT